MKSMKQGNRTESGVRYVVTRIPEEPEREYSRPREHKCWVALRRARGDRQVTMRLRTREGSFQAGRSGSL